MLDEPKIGGFRPFSATESIYVKRKCYRRKGGTPITRTTNEKRRDLKIRKILSAAHRVFCRKGYLAVRMQDIIDECGISRGCIYLYYASVDEVLRAVIAQRNSDRFTLISDAVQADMPFATVLAQYLSRQRERLLGIQNSLFRAYCEYIFSQPKEAVGALRDSQLGYLRKSVLSILMLGVAQGAIRDEKVARLADHFIVVIDGLSVLALSDALTTEVLDAQFGVLQDMIKNLEV